MTDPLKPTTPFMAFSVTYYLEFRCAVYFYYISFSPPKVKLVVWTLYNISIFTW